jgi:hypothetical protein
MARSLARHPGLQAQLGLAVAGTWGVLLGALPWVRLARWTSLAVATFYTVLILFGEAGVKPTQGLLSAGLIMLTWLALLSAVGSTRASREHGEAELHLLSSSRGWRRSIHAFAWPIAATAVIARPLLLGSFALWLSHTARAASLREGFWALALLLGIALYALAVSTSLALLAHLCRELAGRRARLAFLSLVLLPQAAQALWAEVPSVLGGFGSLLEAALNVRHAL